MSKKKTLIVLITILGIQLALHFFLHLRTDWITPPGHLHTMRDIDTYYPGVMLQGKLGAWTHTYPYTTLWTPTVYLYPFFIVAGKIAALFSLDPVIMYEILRVTGGIAVLATTYWLITLLFPVTLRVPAMIFTMIFETGPMWNHLLQTPVWQWTTSYFIQPTLGRNFYIPHHLWGEALGLALLAVVFRAIQKPSRISPILIIILATASPLINPTFATVLIPCVFLPWLAYAAATKTLKRSLLPIAFAIAGIGFAALFTKTQMAAGPMWNTVAATEKDWYTTSYVLFPFLQSYSLYYPFVALLLIVVPISWKKWSASMRLTFFLAFCWSMLPIGLISLAKLPWVPFLSGRVATDLSMVPVGILSTFVFYARRPLRYIVTFLFLMVTGVSLFLSVVYFRQTIQYQDWAVNSSGNSWVEYPTIDLWNGIMELKKIPAGSHIMVCPRIADYIPTYLPLRVYQGSTYEGPGWPERRELSYIFYTGEMPRDQLLWLLKTNNISYVFYGPEEKAATKTSTFYPDILEIIYSNPTVTIYKVRALSP